MPDDPATEVGGGLPAHRAHNVEMSSGREGNVELRAIREQMEVEEGTALEEKLRLLDLHRQLNAVKCKQFMAMLDSSMRKEVQHENAGEVGGGDFASRGRSSSCIPLERTPSGKQHQHQRQHQRRQYSCSMPFRKSSSVGGNAGHLMPERHATTEGKVHVPGVQRGSRESYSAGYSTSCSTSYSTSYSTSCSNSTGSIGLHTGMRSRSLTPSNNRLGLAHGSVLQASEYYSKTLSLSSLRSASPCPQPSPRGEEYPCSQSLPRSLSVPSLPPPCKSPQCRSRALTQPPQTASDGHAGGALLAGSARPSRRPHRRRDHAGSCGSIPLLPPALSSPPSHGTASPRLPLSVARVSFPAGSPPVSGSFSLTAPAGGGGLLPEGGAGAAIAPGVGAGAQLKSPLSRRRHRLHHMNVDATPL